MDWISVVSGAFGGLVVALVPPFVSWKAKEWHTRQKQLWDVDSESTDGLAHQLWLLNDTKFPKWAYLKLCVWLRLLKALNIDGYHVNNTKEVRRLRAICKMP